MIKLILTLLLISTPCWGMTIDNPKIYTGQGASGQVLTLQTGGLSLWQTLSASSTPSDSLSITTVPTNITTSGIKVTMTANNEFYFGDVGYINGNGTVNLANATTINTASAIVLCADSSIATTSGVFLMNGMATNNSWSWATGGIIYLSVNGVVGKTLSQSIPSGTNKAVQVLGIATKSNTIYFNPQLVQIELN